MSMLQTIDYRNLTKAELEQQKEKIVAERLKTLLPGIDVKINLDYKRLEELEKFLVSFQILALKTKSTYQSVFDEQYLIYTVTITAKSFHLKEEYVRKLFPNFFSETEIQISPVMDEQGELCVCITKHFSLCNR